MRMLPFSLTFTKKFTIIVNFSNRVQTALVLVYIFNLSSVVNIASFSRNFEGRGIFLLIARTMKTIFVFRNTNK